MNSLMQGILGFTQLTVKLPVLERMLDMRMMSAFLALATNVVTLVLSVICMLLIYSLLVLDLQVKQQQKHTK